MKKISFPFTILLLFFAFNTYAQSPFHLGVKAGANFTDLSNNLKDYNSKTATGYAAGIMMRLDIKKTYIQADFMYSEKNIDFNGEFVNSSSSELKMKNFEVPLVIGYKLIDGGVYTSIEDAKLTSESVENVFKNFQKNNIGYRVGVGLDLLSFTLDISYDGSLNDIHKDFKSRPNTWFVALGFKFI